jgi:hypothetical protein
MNDPTINPDGVTPPPAHTEIPIAPTTTGAAQSPPQFHLYSVNRHTPGSTAPSTTSTLTPSIRAAEPTPAAETSPEKRPRTSEPLYHASPSPDKAAPNFATRQSDENSVMSGDDSDGREREEDCMEAFFAHANAEEEVLANDTEILNVPVINQWEQEANAIMEVPADEEVITEEVTVIRPTTSCGPRQG